MTQNIPNREAKFDKEIRDGKDDSGPRQFKRRSRL